MTDPNPDSLRDRREARLGAASAVGAYLMWAAFPFYFNAVGHVPATEVLAHRIVWTVVLMAVIVVASGRIGAFAAIVRNPRLAGILCATAVLIAANWYVFIWAVPHQRVLEVSLGYYITPLASVVFGVAFLRERLDRWQWLAVGLAVCGIAVMVSGYGHFPWVALAFPCTFGLYGLLRKIAVVDAHAGLLAESAVLAPVAAAYLFWLSGQGTLAFLHGDGTTDLLLVLAGAVTAAPLVLFALAARRLRLATVGFLFYLSPSGHFLIAVFLYDEPVSRSTAIAFALIGSAIALYTARTLTVRRQE